MWLRSGRIWLSNDNVISSSLHHLDHADWLWFRANRHVSLFLIYLSLTWWRSKIKLNVLAWISCHRPKVVSLHLCRWSLLTLSYLGEEATAWFRLLKRFWALDLGQGGEVVKTLCKLMRKMIAPWKSVIFSSSRAWNLEPRPTGPQGPLTDFGGLNSGWKIIAWCLIGICMVFRRIKWSLVSREVENGSFLYLASLRLEGEK